MVQRGFAPLAKIISTPFALIGRGLFRFILLPAYRWYTSIKQSIRLNPRFNDLRSFRHFLERYAVYVALVIFGTLAIGHNLAARTLRPDEVGVGAIWPSFAQGEAIDLIVESGPAMINKPAVNHLAIGGPVASATTDTSTGGGANQTTTAAPVDAIGGPVTTSPSGTTTTRHGVQQYTVQGGDTISSIAASFGLGSKTVLWANGLGDNDFIKPGQVLKIPPQDGYLYTVQSGDTLDRITAKYGGNAQDILDANDLPTADALQVGQDIVIPGGSPPAVAPAPVVATPQRGLLARLFTEPTNTPPPSAPSGNARFIWPTTNHKINQYFRGRIHTGLDIEGDYSSPIYAAAAGTVVYASYDLSGYGLHIIINHGNGYETLYGHASKIFVHTGDHVRQGQTIAMVGSTGHSTGTHLHFEIRSGGGFLNPLIFF